MSDPRPTAIPTVPLSPGGPSKVAIISRIADLRPRKRWGTAGLVGLGVVILLGLSGMLGVRSATSTATSVAGDADTRLDVVHGAVSRPGLATPFEIRVRRDGGFEGPVRVAVTQDYFDLFEISSMRPDATAGWTAGDMLVWQFERPQGDLLTVSLDARVRAGRQWPAGGTVAVVTGGGEVVVETDILTVIVP